MDQKLIKFYVILLITFIFAINLFPLLFTNLNGTINYIRIKSPALFNREKNKEIDIDYDKANVIIMMDDGWKTQYIIGYNYMNKKRMRGSIAVIPSLIGHPAYLKLNDLQTLNDSGWDLLNHTYDHVNLKDVDYNTQYNQIAEAKNWLNRYGFGDNKDILIYPNGDYNEDTVKAMKELNIVAGRTIKEDFNPKSPGNLYDIKVKNMISNLKPEIVYTWIDKAIQNNSTLVLLFHKLEKITDKSKSQYSINDFYSIIDYLDKERNKLNIITFSDWIRIIQYESK